MTEGCDPSKDPCCPWWCPVHDEHHVVPSFVQDHISQATPIHLVDEESA